MKEFQKEAATAEGKDSAIRAERFKLWRQQNALAIADYNAMIQTIGIPLAAFRNF